MAMVFNKPDDLIGYIKTKDATTAYVAINSYIDNLKNTEVGAQYVQWITDPANLTEVHNLLVTELSIPPRLLAIKRMQYTRALKAYMLVLAMQKAVSRIHSI